MRTKIPGRLQRINARHLLIEQPDLHLVINNEHVLPTTFHDIVTKVTYEVIHIHIVTAVVLGWNGKGVFSLVREQ